MADPGVNTLGYGLDLSLAGDLASDMGVVDPESIEGIAQALARQFDCAPGELLDDSEYGFDLVAYLNTGIVPADLPRIAGAIRAQAARDDRVGSCTVTVTPIGTAASLTLRVAIRVVPLSPSLGPFTLTLVATSGGVVLEAITQ